MRKGVFPCFAETSIPIHAVAKKICFVNSSNETQTDIQKLGVIRLKVSSSLLCICYLSVSWQRFKN